tara:strand:- start:72 stop:182 length:111 start_codon:yes stop_codon:yes gene_type:complete
MPNHDVHMIHEEEKNETNLNSGNFHSNMEVDEDDEN